MGRENRLLPFTELPQTVAEKLITLQAEYEVAKRADDPEMGRRHNRWASYCESAIGAATTVKALLALRQFEPPNKRLRSKLKNKADQVERTEAKQIRTIQTRRSQGPSQVAGALPA